MQSKIGGRIIKIFLTAALLTVSSTRASLAGVDKDVDVQQVQAILTELCYKPGPVDGAWGNKTERAVEQLFNQHFGGYQGQFGNIELEKLVAFSNTSSGKAAKKRCKVKGQERAQPSSVKNSVSEDVIVFKGRSQIPSDLDKQVNDATISYYYKVGDKFLRNKNETFKIRPSPKPIEFKKAIESHKAIERELSNSAIFSYIYFDNGIIVYDALPPNGRYTMVLDNESYFQSNSMGKSITSYLIGHAICQGYIESVDSLILDWPYMENTLYYGQPLITLLNMTAGDTHIIKSGDGQFIKTGRNIHGNAPLIKAARNPNELKNTSRNSEKTYRYSNLTADVLFNYMMHRVGDDFEKFIKDIYQDKIRIKYPVMLAMNPIEGFSRDSTPPMQTRISQGAGQYGISATRYDYLRIAKAILDDWTNDTCVGKYLKEIHGRRVPTNYRPGKWDSSDRRWGKTDFLPNSKSYAGQFYTDIQGLNNQTILVMIGANGQQIAIDMDRKRIIIINAAMEKYYDTFKLGFEPIKYGRIR